MNNKEHYERALEASKKAKLKAYQNYIAKIQDGKALSSSEIKAMRQLEKEFQQELYGDDAKSEHKKTADDNDLGNLSDLRAELVREQIRFAKIKADKAENSVCDLEHVQSEWASRVGEVTKGLENLTYRLPPLLEGKSKSEMLVIIQREVRLLREAYCRHGEYTPEIADALAEDGER